MAQENTILKTAEADYAAVVAQMGALRSDIATLAHSIQTIAGTRGSAMAKGVSDGAADAADYMARKGHEADMRIEGAVAANPYIALALAAGFGVLLGVLTRR